VNVVSGRIPRLARPLVLFVVLAALAALAGVVIAAVWEVERQSAVAWSFYGAGIAVLSLGVGPAWTTYGSGLPETDLAEIKGRFAGADRFAYMLLYLLCGAGLVAIGAFVELA
jgi:hypothetical protein